MITTLALALVGTVILGDMTTATMLIRMGLVVGTCMERRRLIMREFDPKTCRLISSCLARARTR